MTVLGFICVPHTDSSVVDVDSTHTVHGFFATVYNSYLINSEIHVVLTF